MARAEKIMIDGQVLNFEEAADLLCKTKEKLDNANVHLSVCKKENEELKQIINDFRNSNNALQRRNEELEQMTNELESELRVKEDLFAIKDAISEESRPNIDWYENRYQSDCITINQLHTTIDVLTDKLARLREVKGL